MIMARAPLPTIERALLDALGELGLLASGALDAHPLYLRAEGDTLTLATELIEDPDAWTLTPELTGTLAERLEGAPTLAFLSHDLDTGAIHLDLYVDGRLELRWQDALDPALPSDAEVHSPRGECTREDARQFALRMMALPKETPTLDRHAFVEEVLKGFGFPAPLDLHGEPERAQVELRAVDLNAAFTH